MPRKKPNIFKTILLLLFLIALGLLIYVFFWWKNSQSPINPSATQSQKIIIPNGYGTKAIASLLKQNLLIRSELAFRLMVDKKDYSQKLQAGSYELKQSQSLEEIIESLTQGTEDFWVTIPEGKRTEEIAKIFYDEFTSRDLPFSIPDFLDASLELEGYLFPDTYLIPEVTTEEELVNLLRSTFDKKIPDETKVKASKLGLDFQDVLILASLVEREAKFEVDRPMIAGVLLNRLENNMPLQIDATVQYAVGEVNCGQKVSQDCDWWPVITSTKFNSNYNTYQINGLPPAPICNPGLSVIEAVLSPSKHDYLYYLSEDSGKTHYSETLTEHEQKIAKYLY